MIGLGPGAKVAILMHGFLGEMAGKMGLGLLRYSKAEILAVIDREFPHDNTSTVSPHIKSVPVVDSIQKASNLGANVLIIGVAPPGGLLPEGWHNELIAAADLGFSIVNPLHIRLGADAELRAHLKPGAEIWDVRVEPPNLQIATGAARNLSAARVLAVGTDMSVGKMTACLEMAAALNRRSVRAEMIATGQVGMVITGKGVPLDAIRVDYAAGAIERELLNASAENDVLLIEGQGALCHPAASANLALLRGSMPTHLLFCHRAGQDSIRMHSWAKIPDLSELIHLYESLASCCGTFIRPVTIGIALNSSHLNEIEAREACDACEAETGLPVTDPVRFGCDKLVDSLLHAAKHPANETSGDQRNGNTDEKRGHLSESKPPVNEKERSGNQT